MPMGKHILLGEGSPSTAQAPVSSGLYRSKWGRNRQEQCTRLCSLDTCSTHYFVMKYGCYINDWLTQIIGHSPSPSWSCYTVRTGKVFNSFFVLLILFSNSHLCWFFKSEGFQHSQVPGCGVGSKELWNFNLSHFWIKQIKPFSIGFLSSCLISLCT